MTSVRSMSKLIHDRTSLYRLAGLAVGLSLTAGFERFVFLVDPWSPWVALSTSAQSRAEVGVLMTSPETWERRLG